MNTLDQLNGEALAVFAHELRQPLASILLAVRSMYESNDDASASREMCEIVERQARFLAQMIEGVLELSCCRRGSLRVERTWVNLRPIIAAAVETTQPCFAARGHQLTVFLPDQIVTLMADPVRVQQIIVNLLANAAKYTEPGGFIRLAVETTPGWVAIEVRDNGMGIPEQLLARVCHWIADFSIFAMGASHRVEHEEMPISPPGPENPNKVSIAIKVFGVWWKCLAEAVQFFGRNLVSVILRSAECSAREVGTFALSATYGGSASVAQLLNN